MIWWLLALVAVAGTLAYRAAGAWTWAAALAFMLWLAKVYAALPSAVISGLWVVLIVVTVLTVPTVLRRKVLGAPLLALFRRILPQVSQTEQEALDAGTVWWDGDLFSGKPDWKKLLAFPKPTLTAEEQAFVDGPRACSGSGTISRRYPLPPRHRKWTPEITAFHLAGQFVVFSDSLRYPANSRNPASSIATISSSRSEKSLSAPRQARFRRSQ